MVQIVQRDLKPRENRCGNCRFFQIIEDQEGNCQNPKVARQQRHEKEKGCVHFRVKKFEQ